MQSRLIIDMKRLVEKFPDGYEGYDDPGVDGA
jgi:hypothetical protein